MPSAEYIARNALRFLKKGEIWTRERGWIYIDEVKRPKTLRVHGKRDVLGTCDELNDHVEVRRELPLDEARRTLIHEVTHKLFPSEWYPQATEEAVEAKTLEIDKRLGPRRRKQFNAFLQKTEDE